MAPTDLGSKEGQLEKDPLPKHAERPKAAEEVEQRATDRAGRPCARTRGRSPRGGLLSSTGVWLSPCCLLQLPRVPPAVLLINGEHILHLCRLLGPERLRAT